MTNIIEAIAESILCHVRNEDLGAIELVLKAADDRTWREVLRHEFNLVQLMDTILDSDILAPRLVMFDIATISTFHYAALRGVDGILERFLARSLLPVDVALTTGTTALHLACFAGATETVELLIDKYHAGLNRKDIYGWTPLHYSTLGGQLDIVRLLVARGADILSRDKDGTTAAFRAEAFGRDDIVSFLFQSCADDEQLLIDDHSDASEGQSSSLYASIPRKNPTTTIICAHQTESDYEVAVPTKSRDSSYENPYLLENKKSSVSDKGIFDSPSSVGHSFEPTYSSVLVQSKCKSAFMLDEPIYSRNLITESSLGNKKINSASSASHSTYNFAKPNVRQVMTDQLVKPLDGTGSDRNENAKLNVSDDKDLYVPKKQQVNDLEDVDIGYDTLTSIMREEFLKFRALKLQNQTKKTSQMATTIVSVDDYEEIGTHVQVSSNKENCVASNNPKFQDRKEMCLATINESKHNPETAKSMSELVPPPLPPRNSAAKTKKVDNRPTVDKYDERAKMILILTKIEHDSAVMEACFQTLASRLCSPDDWKKLAYSLPLRDSSSLVEKKIKLIEERHPGDVHRQTVELLRQWRSHQGEKATVGGMTLAMRNCGLGELVAAVELGSQEFSA